MDKIELKGLLTRVFVPTAVFTSAYFILGHFCGIPHLLLFCLLGTVILVPVELGVILLASKKEYGSYSLKSAFSDQEQLPAWKALAIALVLFGFAGLLSAFAAPIENGIFADVRASVLSCLPAGFDWTDYEYLTSFSRPILVFTCIYYAAFNVLFAPVTEELYFRGYLTSHYERQGPFTPILITVLFSLYHFWLPFQNVFRILAFAPAAYMTYRKKNLHISIFFHCFCNLFSTAAFVSAVFRQVL